MKRLVSLDSIRGFAILFMLVSHAALFGPFNPEADATPALLPQAPLEMTPPFFFFVTGISLVVSLHRRRKVQSSSAITRHVLIRNGSLILAGMLVHLLNPLWWQDGLSSVANGVYNSFGNGAIMMIGWVNLIAFPLVFFLSCKVLLVLMGLDFVLVSLLLSSQTNPLLLGSLSPLLFTGDFSAFKTLPLVLLGSLIGKQLVAKRSDVAKWAGTLGVLIFIGFLVTLEFFGGGISYGGGRKLYYFAVPMTVGFGLICTGIFVHLENRGSKLVPITVLGQTALLVYLAHEVLLRLLEMTIPYQPSMQLLLLFTLSFLVAIWPVAFLYAKWRWPDFADQYVRLPFYVL